MKNFGFLMTRLIYHASRHCDQTTADETAGLIWDHVIQEGQVFSL